MGRLKPLRRAVAPLAAAALCLAALGAPIANAGPEERLEAIQEKRAQIARELERVDERADGISSEVRQLDRERQSVEADVALLDAELAELGTRIARVRNNLTRAQQELNAVTIDLDVVEERLDASTAAFTERAVSSYKAGPTAYIDGMLSSESFGDLVDRYSYYQAALDADSSLIDEIDLLKSETENKRDEIEEHKNDIARNKLALEQDRRMLAGKRAERADVLAQRNAILDEKQGLLAEVEGRAAKLRALQAQLDQESDQISQLLAANVAAGPLPVGGGQLRWPTVGPLTSGYGYRIHPIFGTRRLHAGIDIGAGYGSAVIASETGRVAYVGSMSGYGNVIVMDHGGGLATTYNHLSAFGVSTGQSVAQGSVIGAVGCTGWCTGPHLHFEVRINGTPVDPLPYLK